MFFLLCQQAIIISRAMNFGVIGRRDLNNIDIFRYLDRIDQNIEVLMNKQDELARLMLQLMEQSRTKRKGAGEEQPKEKEKGEEGEEGEEEANSSFQNKYQEEKEEYRSVNRFGLVDNDVSKMDQFISEQAELEKSNIYDQESKMGLRYSIYSPYALHSESNSIDIDQPSDILSSLASEFKTMNLKFTQAVKTYRFPQLTQQCSMEEILDKNNIMIVMKLSNSSQIVGAFTEIPFSSKPVRIPRDNPKSFLCNLSNEHFLYASKTNKTHSVDRNYLMFGNWEIKIKVGENILYSDIGKKGGCFMRGSFGGRDIEEDPRAWLFGDEHLSDMFELERYVIYAFT